MRYLIGAESAQQFQWRLLDDGVERVEEREAARGDARPDDAPVGRITALGDESAGVEAGEQARDIGHGGDHAVADGRAGESLWGCGAENAQNVVLGMGEMEWAQTKLEGAIELIGDAQQAQEQLRLRGGKCGLARG